MYEAIINGDKLDATGERREITIERLRAVLRHDPDTGKLYWLPRGKPKFDNLWAGKEAMTAIHEYGYRYGTVDGQHIYAHRAIWALEHGYWPDQIDHDNGDTSLNLSGNLNEATNHQNRKNMARAKNNTSGYAGVSWDKARSRWAVTVGGARYGRTFRGRFKTLEEAVEARAKALEAQGYHPNHGREPNVR